MTLHPPLSTDDAEVPLFMSPVVDGQVDVVVHAAVLQKADAEGWCVGLSSSIGRFFLATCSVSDQIGFFLMGGQGWVIDREVPFLAKLVDSSNFHPMTDLFNIPMDAVDFTVIILRNDCFCHLIPHPSKFYD